MSELINAGGKVQCFHLPITGKTTQLAVSGASAATAVLVGGVYRIETDVASFIAAGATAALTDMPLQALIAEYFYVNDGDTVAAISAESGTVSLTLC